MKPLKRLGLLILLLACTLSCAASLAWGASEGPTTKPFEKGQTVCFLGDSIFHGGKMHSDLLLFYATRFPASPLTVFNLGVAGDTAGGAIDRLEWDVKPRQPDVAVVMFGMNDVGRWLYGGEKVTPATLTERGKLLERNAQNMQQLTDALKAMDSRIILCTPTPYDQTTQRKTANAMGVDTALAMVADNVRQLAREGGYGLVDFHGEMNRIIRAQQAKDPAFTMMDAARVHPNDAGQLLMAFLFLKAQGVSPVDWQATIDAGTGAVSDSARCQISGVERADKQGHLRFEILAEALPFPLAEDVNVVREWVPFDEELNSEKLVIRNLPAGQYELLIDDRSVGSWSSEAWVKGINLAGNRATPDYQQATAVMRLNEKRRRLEESTLRVFAALEADVLRPRKVDLTDMQAVRAAMDKAIEEEKEKKSWRVSYFTNLAKVYVERKPQQKQIEAQLAEMTRQLFNQARPVPHRYEVRQVEGD